eukprot:906461-Rhodomonas_salina.1
MGAATKPSTTLAQQLSADRSERSTSLSLCVTVTDRAGEVPEGLGQAFQSGGMSSAGIDHPSQLPLRMSGLQ